MSVNRITSINSSPNAQLNPIGFLLRQSNKPTNVATCICGFFLRSFRYFSVLSQLHKKASHFDNY